MNRDFLDLADSIKVQLENRFNEIQLKDFYIYVTLLELIKEYHREEFISKRTDIGIAAVKLLDSDEDNKLVEDICKLAFLYQEYLHSSCCFSSRMNGDKNTDLFWNIWSKFARRVGCALGATIVN